MVYVRQHGLRRRGSVTALALACRGRRLAPASVAPEAPYRLGTGHVYASVAATVGEGTLRLWIEPDAKADLHTQQRILQEELPEPCARYRVPSVCSRLVLQFPLLPPVTQGTRRHGLWCFETNPHSRRFLYLLSCSVPVSILVAASCVLGRCSLRDCSCC